MKKIFLVLQVFISMHLHLQAQELYIFSEPASNMPAKTIGLKFTGFIPAASTLKQRYKPEVMVGVNKNWMVHLSGTLSNYYSSNVRYESAKAYLKYRFFSNDGIHTHFRMAAFGDVSLTRSPYLYDEMTLEGDNDGAQVGLIATKLVNKLAVSSTVAYTGVFRNKKFEMHDQSRSLKGINYSLSAGYLVLPKEYVDYKQTNLNLYCELLGLKSIDNRQYLVDLAPAVQLIFNSNTKLNVGYRFQLASNMNRMAKASWLIGFEHTIFNVWK